MLDTNTLVIVLTFLGTQIGALLTFAKWYVEIKAKVEHNGAEGERQRAEIREILVSLLHEMGFVDLAKKANGQLTPPAKDDRS